jgi:hypothetical protein
MDRRQDATQRSRETAKDAEDALALLAVSLDMGREGASS